MSISVSTIVDRDTFLAFRAAWRVAYAAASQDVRDVKRTMRGEVATRRLAGTEAELNRIDGRMSSLQYDRHLARATARDLMDDLDEAKERRTKLLAARDEAEAVPA
jgi:hypothetical protein